METEKAKIRLMRSYVESKDPSAKDEDDLTIRRFLRARDLDIEKASAMFLKYLKWRLSYLPNGSISESEIANELARDMMFVQGFDKQRRPIGVFFAAKHFQNKDDPDQLKRFTVYIIQKMSARIPPGQENYAFIADFKGWKYSNFDLHGYLGAVSMLQDYFPERLGKLYIVHAPLIFTTVWKIVYPFIDNKTKKKIVFVENKKLKSTLLEDIDKSQLPEIYGGQLPLVRIQDS